MWATNQLKLMQYCLSITDYIPYIRSELDPTKLDRVNTPLYRFPVFSFIIQGPPRGALQAMLANLNGEDDAAPAQTPAIVGPLPIKMSGGRALAEVPPIGNITIERNDAPAADNDVNEAMPVGNAVRENIEDGLGLGDLAGITVSNEADPLSYDVCKISRFSLIIVGFINCYRATGSA